MINKASILKKICPVCNNEVKGNIGIHLKKVHGGEEFNSAVISAKKGGMADSEIGELFNITFRQLEKIITEKYGINISTLKKVKKIKYWSPKNFKEETTTVWSFKQRGNWATHDGRYRGNWSPYIPRNVILKYSKPGDIVLDYFSGGGTTAIEAKLLGRKCIIRDINSAAIDLTKENLKFELLNLEDYPIYEPDIAEGDARNLTDIKDESIDLICAHPPYAGIIKYSSKVDGDLSKLSIDKFLIEMEKVARESYRVLKPGSKCAILIGDTRKKKHVIPIGFKTINVFLKEGFIFKELVIKRQHNCKTAGFWYNKSIKYNFLLLAHEYLPIFEKPELKDSLDLREEISAYSSITKCLEKPPIKKVKAFETTTVWIFPQKDFEKSLNKNVINRYSNGKGYLTIAIDKDIKKTEITDEEKEKKGKGLLFLKSPFLNNNPSQADIKIYLNEIVDIVAQKSSEIIKGGFIAIQTQDVRINKYVESVAEKIINLLSNNNLWLKEIVVIAQEEQKLENNSGIRKNLKITHQYLLIYKVIK